MRNSLLLRSCANLLQRKDQGQALSLQDTSVASLHASRPRKAELSGGGFSAQAVYVARELHLKSKVSDNPLDPLNHIQRAASCPRDGACPSPSDAS